MISALVGGSVTVEFEPDQGVWHVRGHPEAVHVLGNPATFSSNTVRGAAEAAEFTEGNIFQLDPPKHRKMRDLVTHAFTPKVAANLAPRIAQLTHELLDTVEGGDRLELIADLAHPLPVIVIAELLGVPSSDRATFRRWVDAMFGDRTTSSGTEQSAARGAQAAARRGSGVQELPRRARDAAQARPPRGPPQQARRGRSGR